MKAQTLIEIEMTQLSRVNGARDADRTELRWARKALRDRFGKGVVLGHVESKLTKISSALRGEFTFGSAHGAFTGNSDGFHQSLSDLRTWFHKG